jgi:hypothetical protein
VIHEQTWPPQAILVSDWPRTPSDGKSSPCLWQGELKNIKEKNGHLCCNKILLNPNPNRHGL